MAAWNFQNLAGSRFGRCTVSEQDGKQGKHVVWVCRCDCGTVFRTLATNLKTGNTKSCGCLSREATSAARKTHGMTRTTEYNIHQSMIARCSRPCNNKHFARGIKVCDRWVVGDGSKSGFECFLSDMGMRPPGKSLDRVDNDGDYTPDNCRWATRTEQNRNTTRNVFVSIAGVRMCVSEALLLVGMSKSCYDNRRRRGWTLDEIFSRPVERKLCRQN